MVGLHDEARLDRKFIELAKLMNIYLNHFPKHEKYGLALEIRQAAYDVYGYIVESNHANYLQLPEVYRLASYTRA